MIPLSPGLILTLNKSRTFWRFIWKQHTLCIMRSFIFNVTVLPWDLRPAQYLPISFITSFHTPPRYWGRYVDDTMVIIDGSQVDNFTQHLNSVHNSIKFTIEHENNHSIAMLDTLITRNPNVSLSFSVYRKKYTHRSIPQLLQSPAFGTQIRCYPNSHSPRQSFVLRRRTTWTRDRSC